MIAVTAWDELPVVVTVAPTGAEVTRADNPALPHSPAEIAADVIASAEAGAAVCHLHVREDDGSPSSRRAVPSRYRAMPVSPAWRAIQSPQACIPTCMSFGSICGGPSVGVPV